MGGLWTQSRRVFGALAAVGVAGLAGGGCSTGGGVLAGTGGAGAAGGKGGADAQCSNLPRPAPKVIPDIMIVLDTSTSMNDAIDASCTTGCASKWTASVQAIESVISADAAPVYWGLTFMAGSANACAPETGVLVGVNESIAPVLAGRTTAGALTAGGYRPTRAAVSLAAMNLPASVYSTERVILLITDGVPGCVPGAPDALGDDTTEAVRAVDDARGAGVSTFVVGLATSGGPADAALDQISRSGGLPRDGSPAYFPASSFADVVAALNVLVSETTDCVFAVPPPASNDGVESRENIAVYVDTGVVLQDAVNGWTYTDQGHMAVRLHGAACDAVRNDPARKVGIVLVCQFGR
jgi:hypothetical protein